MTDAKVFPRFRRELLDIGVLLLVLVGIYGRKDARLRRLRAAELCGHPGG